MGGYWFQPSTTAAAAALADVERAGVVREALAEVDGPVLRGEARHGLEDGGGQVGEDGVHGRGLAGGEWRRGGVAVRPGFGKPGARAGCQIRASAARTAASPRMASPITATPAAPASRQSRAAAAVTPPSASTGSPRSASARRAARPSAGP